MATGAIPKIKRSNSFKSYFRLGGENPPPRAPDEVERQPDPDQRPDPEEIVREAVDREVVVENTDQHMAFTLADPIGAILLGLAQDNAAMCNRVGLRESNVNIRELTRAFYEHSVQRRNTEAQFLEVHASMVEKRILEKELSSHLISMSSSPPAQYSEIKTLFTTSQRAEVFKIFPCRGAKFSGGTKDGSVDVVEFLGSMTGAQEICNLSRPEFLELLKHCTTGKAHLLLLEWIANGDEIESIYYNLSLHFDKRLSAEDARAHLYSLKAAKNMNLADLTAKILDLAGRACTALPPGESRTNLYNMEAVQAIIKSLPPQSSALAHNTYSSVSARLGRAATAGELSRALNIYRTAIDKEIKTNGAQPQAQERGNGGAKNGGFKKNWGKPKTANSAGTPNAFALESPQSPPQSQGGGVVATVATPQQQGNNPKNFKGQNKRGGYNGKGRNPNHPSQGQQHGQQSNKAMYGQHGHGGGATYCSLCGQHCHTAATGCPYILDDSGKHVGIMPTKSTCAACPQYVSPRLNHPASLCPYRPTGPFSRN